MLSVKGLRAKVGEKEILKGLDLEIGRGEVHAIMGPNGSGKSTLAHVLSGRDGYTVTAGTVTFEGQDLLALAPEERAHLGLFLAFQYPVELPGSTTPISSRRRSTPSAPRAGSRNWTRWPSCA